VVSKPEYECRSCGAVFSIEEFLQNKFCPKCGMHLQPKIVKTPFLPSTTKTFAKPIELSRDDINVHTLFTEFQRLENFSCGEGVSFLDVDEWISARKRAYADFKERFSQKRLVDWEKLRKDFQDFLHFKNNKSWTTLYRSGLKALEDLESLWKLLVFLQDESVEVAERVREGLVGKYHCRGIGQNILTALLHTFDHDKYGVLNSRTEETLRLLRRKPKQAADVGLRYVFVNQELLHLRNELDTDLTTIDSFMWYVSKIVKVID
jgi:DNA-directed RNA polymerase subunit RPC12/RpoP